MKRNSEDRPSPALVYDVAFSFAGEDRAYVETVANCLLAQGVKVFYDRFEEAEFWGKNLYEHLAEVYQKRARFIIMFISAVYVSKAWTAHERRHAQARALTESTEYILPACFDESIEVPGLPKTVAHVSLAQRTPQQFADLIVQKLRKAGVDLRKPPAYAEQATADVDFPLNDGGAVARIIKALKSLHWYTQSPAIEELLGLDWATVSPDQAFVLGRNLYQCACGGERRARSVLKELRRELAALPADRAMDLLNGMYFEVYFNSKGEFRGSQLKDDHLDKLFALQTVSKYEPTIAFIRNALAPYSTALPVLPSTTPELVRIDLTVKRGDPPTIKTLKVGDRSLLATANDGGNAILRAWRISREGFTVTELRHRLARKWGIPMEQLQINSPQQLDPDTMVRLPKDTHLQWPDSEN